MGGDSKAGLRVAARLGYTGGVQTLPQHRYWNRIAWLVVLLACGRGQTRDQTDFWQEALPDPIAVLEPWLSEPNGPRVIDEDCPAHIAEITTFIEGPADATGADHTVLLHGTAMGERKLHLRLAPGAALPLYRNEAVHVRVFSRRLEGGEAQRSLIVYARRPLGTGADFKPVLIVSRFDDLIPQDALPHPLAGLARSEQVVYREAAKGEGDCAVATAHYMTVARTDVATNVARRAKPLAPGTKQRRQDLQSAYDLTIHDARRTSVAPCPMPDETRLTWSAVWVEEDASKIAAKSAPPALDPPILPLSVTPTGVQGAHPPVRKPRKNATTPSATHEHQAPRP